MLITERYVPRQPCVINGMMDCASSSTHHQNQFEKQEMLTSVRHYALETLVQNKLVITCIEEVAP